MRNSLRFLVRILGARRGTHWRGPPSPFCRADPVSMRRLRPQHLSEVADLGPDLDDDHRPRVPREPITLRERICLWAHLQACAGTPSGSELGGIDAQRAKYRLREALPWA